MKFDCERGDLHNFICATLDWWPQTKCNYNQCPWESRHSQFESSDIPEMDPHLVDATLPLKIGPIPLRFAGTRQDNKEERSNTTERKIPPQKTQSFRERKRSQSWIRRQFSRQMSLDYDLSGSDYPAAVAAAAFAIQSLEESKSRDKKETAYGPDKSLNKMNSKLQDTGVLTEPLKNQNSKTSNKDPDNKPSTSKNQPEKQPSFKKRISFADIDEISSNKPEKPALEKAPSMKRPPAFADKQLNKTESKKPETTLPKPVPVETRKQSATKPGPGDSKADAWEKEEMASIKERYEKLKTTIDIWETKKKKKAKRKIERIEAELDKRRAKAMQNHRNEITRIEGIAGGAKAQAEKNRKNEEFKVKEKANKIRLTGKLPATCLCF
ncbi:hypothetical protein DH2020_032375 [Rehmannia glutinosa]|uniref:Remorin C-terminal domain-containing protein n=1 Tax=Rehmannia glutinosa TaxID=99300 RepID=A0ABR0VJB1_REHGL